MVSYLSNGRSGGVIDRVDGLIKYAGVNEGWNRSCFRPEFKIPPDSNPIGGIVGQAEILSTAVNRILWGPGDFYLCVSMVASG
jgi:hypothetical protein